MKRSGPILEWLLWIAIAAVAISMTGNFNQEIQLYRFGADGWPIVICIGIMIGATGQLANRFLNGDFRNARVGLAGTGGQAGTGMIVRVAIFVLPFLFLFLATRIGAYIATPLFVMALLYLLDVRSPVAAVSVTAIITALLLLVFTRFFFVALPTGRIHFFYEMNVAIIEFARIGM